MLYELAEARIAGVHHPKATRILKQIVSAITMQFNFRKKVMDNVALHKILVNKATAVGVTVHVSLLVVNLKANMEYTQSHEWGREFIVSGQAIRKKYPDYTNKHDQKSYDDMVKADHVRVLREAPAPSDEQANQVRAFRGQLAALQRTLTITKRMPSQWTRNPAGAKRGRRRRRRGRRKTTRAEADAANTAATRKNAAS